MSGFEGALSNQNLHIPGLVALLDREIRFEVENIILNFIKAAIIMILY